MTAAETRGQFSAIAAVRWRIFVHSLRTRRGSLELASRIFIGIFFGTGGLFGAIGLGAGAYYFVEQRRAAWLAGLFWSVFLFWQLFPVMAQAFSEKFEPSTILRFPLSYRSYFLVRMLYGSLDVSTGLGVLWSLAIAAGVSAANVRLLPWALIVVASFVVLNISLARLTFAWVERWLAQRRTREIFGIVLLLLALSGQLIGPLMARYGRRATPEAALVVRRVFPESQLLPPGAAASAMAGMVAAQPQAGLVYFALLWGYTAVFVWLLHLRLLKQYRGENLSESAVPSPVTADKVVRPSWRLPGLPAPVAAVFEKELRYLLRSGPMLFTLIVPGFMLLIFRLGPGGSRESGQFLVRAPNLAFPIGAVYSLLLLTNLVYNTFGADGPGLQMFFASPVRFRKIVLGKNLAHLTVLVFEMVLVWAAVWVLFKPAALDITLATLSGIAFAAPVNFLAGNLLSLYSPKKVDYGVLGRQRASQTGVLASFGMQFAIVAIGAGVVFFARYAGSYWIAALIFVILAAIGWTSYLLVLHRMDGLALKQREVLLTELCRAQS